jgi:hypothetical protein
MIDFFGYKPSRGYFAACNGYSGFYSLFDRTFNPLCHDRVFVLKGGPGTGKSTIMKGVIKWANSNRIFSEAIYCSSDPLSLDGVILRRENKSIAILDGTAPHTYDPKYPGVKDEIINLGEGFNNTKLASFGDKVCALGKQKSEAYEDAYSYLKLSGEIKKILNKKHREAQDNTALDIIIEELKEKIKCDDDYDEYDVFCISSFGRFGYSRLDELSCEDKTVIELQGDGYTEYAVLDALTDYAIKDKKAVAVSPSALDPDSKEALYTENYVFTIGFKGDTVIDTRGIAKLKKETDSLNKLYSTTLELAKEEFSKASDIHFKIEEIYRSCMDFEVNDALFVNLIGRIRDFI